ncbi:hypothetical protein PG995_007294 [Apiospora arundinis]
MAQQQSNYGFQQGGVGLNPMAMNQFNVLKITTVLVGGLSGYVAEDELRSFFQGFGEITYVKVPPGKRCGRGTGHQMLDLMAMNQFNDPNNTTIVVGGLSGLGAWRPVRHRSARNLYTPRRVEIADNEAYRITSGLPVTMPVTGYPAWFHYGSPNYTTAPYAEPYGYEPI